MRRIETIGTILQNVIQGLGIEKRITEERAVVDWEEIVGRRIAEHARALRVSDGRLFVEVDSSVWAQELSLMRRQLLAEVNARVGRESIEHIHFVLGGARANDASDPGGREDETNGEQG